jgi:hypothetical protein
MVLISDYQDQDQIQYQIRSDAGALGSRGNTHLPPAKNTAPRPQRRKSESTPQNKTEVNTTNKLPLKIAIIKISQPSPAIIDNDL